MSAQFRPYSSLEALRDPPIKHLVQDGMLLANAGVRLAIKNRIIVQALRDNSDFGETALIAAVQREFLARATETFDELERVLAAQDSAKRLGGRPTHNTDYRRVDLPTLKRRTKVLARLAEALTTASSDDQLALALIGAARDSALQEIADALAGSSVGTLSDFSGPSYDDGLQERKASLAKEIRRLVGDE
jgi:hypothetical protein